MTGDVTEVKEYGLLVGKVEEKRLYNRFGKKAGKLSSTDESGSTVSYELRVDVTTGMWGLMHPDGEVYYESASKHALQCFLRDKVREEQEVTWTRYIDVNYRATKVAGWSDRSLGIGDDREEPDADGDIPEICGLTLTWQVCDYSEPVSQPGRKTKLRRRRRVLDVEGESYAHPEWCDEELEPGLVPYSPERIEFLVRVQRMLGQIDARMVELFRGTPDELARKLDALAKAGTQKLLPGSRK